MGKGGETEQGGGGAQTNPLLGAFGVSQILGLDFCSLFILTKFLYFLFLPFS